MRHPVWKRMIPENIHTYTRGGFSEFQGVLWTGNPTAWGTYNSYYWNSKGMMGGGYKSVKAQTNWQDCWQPWKARYKTSIDWSCKCSCSFTEKNPIKSRLYIGFQKPSSWWISCQIDLLRWTTIFVYYVPVIPRSKLTRQPIKKPM